MKNEFVFGIRGRVAGRAIVAIDELLTVTDECLLEQKLILPDFNDTEDLINSNKRQMDACEIANFLASELFMHQVKEK
jgi:hypothetical protein